MIGKVGGVCTNPAFSLDRRMVKSDVGDAMTTPQKIALNTAPVAVEVLARYGSVKRAAAYLCMTESTFRRRLALAKKQEAK